MRHAHKIDSNQPQIVKTLRGLGASVEILSMIPRKLDLLVGVAGIDQRAEIKDGSLPPSERKLTEAEQKTFDTWQGRRPVILETESDAIDLVRRLRLEAHQCAK